MSKRKDTPSNVPASVVISVRNDGVSATAKVRASNNPVEISADNALWDTVAGTFVKPEDCFLR